MTPTEFRGEVAAIVAAAETPAPKVNGHPVIEMKRRDEGSYVAGKVFSPSQINTYLTCGAKWWFRYGVGQDDPTNGARHMGICGHAVMQADMLHKLGTGKNMDRAALLDTLDKQWKDQERVAWAPNEDAAEFKAMGAKVIECYAAEVAPTLRPAAVEQAVEGSIGGVPVRGKIDLLEEVGSQGEECLTRAGLLSVTDLKITARKEEPSDSYQLQLAIYHKLKPGTTPNATLIQITKTKEPRAVVWPVKLSPAKLRYADEIVPLVKEAIETRLYVPNRGSTMCSRKYCGHWRRCEAEFGGEVNP